MAPLFTGFRFGFGKEPSAGDSSPGVKATGGSVSAGIPSGDYLFFVFHADTPSPACVFTANQSITGAELLVIGGGGAGGSGHGAGGGAGGVVYGPNVPFPAGTYPVSIGGGGAKSEGPPTFNTSPQTTGGNTTLGSSPSEYYAIGGGGGKGGGWKDGGDPNQYANDGSSGANGGSGGGSAGNPSDTTFPGGEGDVNGQPTENRWGGQANQWAHDGGSCNNGPAARGGAGGGGAACQGQNIEINGPGKNPNPTSHPTIGPATVRGSNKTTSYPDPNSSPYFMTEPPFSPTGGIWPAIAIDNAPGASGAFGGHGVKMPMFPAPVISPAFPTDNNPQTDAPTNGKKADFESQVGPEGYYGGGGGGAPHGFNNPGSPRYAGMGGIGGGGEGGSHNTDEVGTGLPGWWGTGSGGGGGGSQEDTSGAGSPGIVVIRIPAS